MNTVLGALGSQRKESLIARPQGAMVVASVLPETNSSFNVRTGWTVLVWIPEDPGTPFNTRRFSLYVSFFYTPTPKLLPSLTHIFFPIQLILFHEGMEKKGSRFWEDERTCEKMSKAVLHYTPKSVFNHKYWLNVAFMSKEIRNFRKYKMY